MIRKGNIIPNLNVYPIINEPVKLTNPMIKNEFVYSIFPKDASKHKAKKDNCLRNAIA